MFELRGGEICDIIKRGIVKGMMSGLREVENQGLGLPACEISSKAVPRQPVTYVAVAPGKARNGLVIDVACQPAVAFYMCIHRMLKKLQGRRLSRLHMGMMSGLLDPVL